MNLDEILTEVKRRAGKDPALLRALLATREDPHPVSRFCAVVTELGYPVYEMDLISAGEEYYASMRRSTNGGGENSPLLKGEDVYYEIFMAELAELQQENGNRNVR